MAESASNQAQSSGENGGCTGRANRVIRKRLVVLAILGVAGLLLGLEPVHVLFGNNVHTVLSGKVYRCAQPTKELLRELTKKYGIKTVVNLRGTCPMSDWYQEESTSTGLVDICQEDLSFSAGRLPSATELRELIQVLDQAEYPLLLHCRRGADRTGMASAIVLLLQEELTLPEARNQLALRFGHIPLGRTEHLAGFLGYYVDWLGEHKKPHSPNAFRDWILNGYRGGPCHCTFEKIVLPDQPIRAGQPFSIQVRLRNSSGRPWFFSPSPSAGVHLFYLLTSNQGIKLGTGRTGFFDDTIGPGKTLDLVLPVAAIAEPGQYRLVLDMVDEQMGPFVQMGSEPKEIRLDVQ